jgi:hypothetical protein
MSAVISATGTCYSSALLNFEHAHPNQAPRCLHACSYGAAVVQGPSRHTVGCCHLGVNTNLDAEFAGSNLILVVGLTNSCNINGDNGLTKSVAALDMGGGGAD